MPFKLKDGAETDGLPSITLAGERYFVPRLALRHRMAVSLLQPKVNALIQRFREAFPDPEDIKPGVTFEFAEDDYLAMVDIVSHGIIGLYPDAKRDALLDQPIEFEELYAAWPIVVEQGASRRPVTGEAVATSLSGQTTGADSSQTSA